MESVLLFRSVHPRRSQTGECSRWRSVGSSSTFVKRDVLRCFAQTCPSRLREPDAACCSLLHAPERPSSVCRFYSRSRSPARIHPDQGEDFDPVIQSLRQGATGNPADEQYAYCERPLIDSEKPFFCDKSKFLLEEGLSAAQLKKLATEFKILASTSREQLVAILKFLKSLNIEGQTAGVVLLRYPKIVSQSAEHLDAKIKLLEESGLSKASLKKFVVICPRMMCASFETLQKRVAQLSALGIDGEGMNKIIWRSPRTLSWDIDSLVTSLEKLGASKNSIRLYLTRYPLSGNKALAKKLAVLEQLGFDRNSEKIFRALWRLSCVQDDRIVQRFQFLKNQGLSHDEVMQLVTVQPDVLAKTEENLLKKIDYLINVLNCDVKEIVKFPAFLTYSLEGRIIPRFNSVIEANNEGRLKGVMSLSNVLVRSNQTFLQLFVTQKQE